MKFTKGDTVNATLTFNYPKRKIAKKAKVKGIISDTGMKTIGTRRTIILYHVSTKKDSYWLSVKDVDSTRLLLTEKVKK